MNGAPVDQRAQHSAVVDEYSQLASGYDRRWANYVEATVRETLQRIECRAGDRILDVACGTGVLLKKLSAQRAGVKLTGVDLAPNMLHVARQRIAAPISLITAQADALPLNPAVFDSVVSTSALHFFGAPHRALAEMKRVLRPNGRLVLTDWCGDYLSCRLLDRWLRIRNRAHVRVYGAEDLRRLLMDAGFQNIVIDRYKIDWFWGMMTARATANPS